jgi:hypothetical protein
VVNLDDLQAVSDLHKAWSFFDGPANGPDSADGTGIAE